MHEPSDAPPESRVREMLDENTRLRDELVRLQARTEVLRERLSAQDAADEHHRASWRPPGQRPQTPSRTSRRHRCASTSGDAGWLTQRSGERSPSANAARPSRKRAAVIAVLGRRARTHLDIAD